MLLSRRQHGLNLVQHSDEALVLEWTRERVFLLRDDRVARVVQTTTRDPRRIHKAHVLVVLVQVQLALRLSEGTYRLG